ncbi:MAG: B12-binding domain-containing radical SAM protein [Deltaproteobacteria bacterium]
MKRSNILLVNPWIHDFAAYDLWARPMGLLVLGTRLRQQGWEPRLLDCLDHDHPAAAPARLKDHAHGRFLRSPIPRPAPLKHVERAYARYGLDPEIVLSDLQSMPVPAAVLVTSLMTYWYPGVQETVGLIRESFPGVPIILGGIYASLLPDHARQHVGPDELVTGPGESWLFPALFKMTGVSPRDERTSNDLEFRPALDLMRRVRFLPLLTSRGCPYRCSYCASHQLVGRFLRRKIPDILEEIEHARLRHGVYDIALYDDAFLIDSRKYAIPLLQAVADKMPGLRWHTPNGLHAAAIDPLVAKAMKMAGFETIRIGLESASDEFHVSTGGKVELRNFFAAVRNLHEAGFAREQIGVYLLVGVPAQSRAQIERDVELVLEAGAIPKLAEYSPIPGTAMWRDAMRASPYPIDREPLYQNCTLLPAAQPQVDWAFLQKTRQRIRESLESDVRS